MTNPSKIKGTAWESENVRLLSRWWPKIKRAALEGGRDVGDLTHPEGWAVECKNASPITLPKWLREAEAEAANKGVPWFVVLVKNRRSKGETGAVEDGYAVTRTCQWARLAYEHEHANAFADAVIEIEQRFANGGLSGAGFRVLVREAIYRYREAMNVE